MAAEPLVGDTTRVGEIEVTGVLDGYGWAAPENFFGTSDGTDVASVFALEEHRRWLNHEGMLVLPISCFLVRAAGRTALIDLGMGTFNVPGFSGGQLPDALAAAGVAPANIDTVILSHLHFDHVGWATTKDEHGARHLTFPNATIRCGAPDWQHFVAEEHAHAAVLHTALQPMAERLEPCADGDQVFPGITVRAAPGHTPGHHAYVIADHGERAILLGDATHCPIQLEYGEWEVMGDVDPKLAVATRTALLRELDGDVAVGAPHFPGLRLGRLVTGATGKRWIA